MSNKPKRKRRLRKSMVRRRKEVDEFTLEKAWRNYWVKRGILSGEASK